MFYSLFIWSQWGDGHGSIGLLQARFLIFAGFQRDSNVTRTLTLKIHIIEILSTYTLFDMPVYSSILLKCSSNINVLISYFDQIYCRSYRNWCSRISWVKTSSKYSVIFIILADMQAQSAYVQNQSFPGLSKISFLKNGFTVERRQHFPIIVKYCNAIFEERLWKTINSSLRRAIF